MVSFHKDSVAQALLDLFPDIGLKRAKLQSRRIPLSSFSFSFIVD